MNILPERWFLKITPDNIDSVNLWRAEKGLDSLGWGNDYPFVYNDGWGTRELNKTFSEITFDQFKLHILNILPEKWCMKCDYTHPFNNKLIKYANENGTSPPYTEDYHQLYFHFPAYIFCNSPCITSKQMEAGYTEISLDQFDQLVLKQDVMKLELKEIPIINGANHQLKAFIQDCKQFGYSSSHLDILDDYSTTLKLNGNSKTRILSESDSFKTLCLVSHKMYSGDIGNLRIRVFNLPQDWVEALNFMKENMEAWKEMNEKPKFKVGDWVVIHTPAPSSRNKKDTCSQITEVRQKSWLRELGDCISYKIAGWHEHVSGIRLATPEEIEQAQVTIFKMTSSSGDFELEVSKKGIYYRPEGRWLADNFTLTDNTVIENKSDTGEFGSYKVVLSKVDVGCKKDTLVSQWKLVYDCYNSIKK